VYRNPQSGRQCESRHLIQIDHRIPKALGGADALENLRLHCAGHNRLAAIRVFGVEKMAAFISE
jgi:5-methylcytosine-specific restriction endonuclease McrA